MKPAGDGRSIPTEAWSNIKALQDGLLRMKDWWEKGLLNEAQIADVLELGRRYEEAIKYSGALDYTGDGELDETRWVRVRCANCAERYPTRQPTMLGTIVFTTGGQARALWSKRVGKRVSIVADDGRTMTMADTVAGITGNSVVVRKCHGCGSTRRRKWSKLVAMANAMLQAEGKTILF